MSTFNINTYSIMICCERAVQEACQNTNKEYVIESKSEEEEDAILSESGMHIIVKAFDRQAPFYDWIDKYEEEYIKKKLDIIDRHNDIKFYGDSDEI